MGCGSPDVTLPDVGSPTCAPGPTCQRPTVMSGDPIPYSCVLEMYSCVLEILTQAYLNGYLAQFANLFALPSCSWSFVRLFTINGYLNDHNLQVLQITISNIFLLITAYTIHQFLSKSTFVYSMDT
jgi:hypothetical protein